MRLYLASSNAGKLRELSALARAEGIELATVPGYGELPTFPEDEPSFALNALEKALYYSRNIALMNSPRQEPRGSGAVGDAPSGQEPFGYASLDSAPFDCAQGRRDRQGRPRGWGGGLKEGRVMGPVAGATGLNSVGSEVLVVADDSGLVVEALGGRPGVRSARYAGAEATDDDNNRKLVEELSGVPAERRAARFVCVLALARGEEVLGIFSDYVEGQILDAPRGSGGFGYDPLFFLPERGCTTAELAPEEKNRVSHRGKAFGKLLAFVKERDP